jgi:hypothetical protein
VVRPIYGSLGAKGLRSVTSMTKHHPNLATVIHEQNMENYLQNWNVQEYAYT